MTDQDTIRKIAREEAQTVLREYLEWRKSRAEKTAARQEQEERDAMNEVVGYHGQG